MVRVAVAAAVVVVVAARTHIAGSRQLQNKRLSPLNHSQNFGCKMLRAESKRSKEMAFPGIALASSDRV